jgi:hypothetical protein
MGCCAGKKSGSRSNSDVKMDDKYKTPIALVARPGKRKDRIAAGFKR